MADPTVFLNPNIKNSGAYTKLTVDGQRLTLSERTSDQWDANPIRSRIMGSRPYNLVYVKFLRVEPSHPILPV
jgi:hypothetical protein